MAQEDYKISETVKTVNPYTFVPIEPNVRRKNGEAYYQNEELHTGVLHCSLHVRTPLAIPNTEEMKEEKLDKKGEEDKKDKKDIHRIYPFYREDGRCVIPGSALRGMLRSVYETSTNSCFVTLKEETLLSKRVNIRGAFNAGILKKEGNEYRLYKAKRYLVPIKGYKAFQEAETVFQIQEPGKFKVGKEPRWIKAGDQYLKTGDWVSFRWKKTDYRKRGREVWDGLVTGIEDERVRDLKGEGVLFIGEKIGNKHGESIFEIARLENQAKNEEIKKAYHRLEAVLESYQNQSINRKLGDDHNGYAGIDKLNLEKGIPIWYSIGENGKIHFSYAAIGREVYDRTLNDLAGRAKRCTDRKALCEACLLFGMVGGAGEEEKGLGSRIRVTNACGSSQLRTEYATLKELGMPRYSYLPFYAKSSQKGVPAGSYDDQGVRISGRKYYWHNKKVMEGAVSYSTTEKTGRNATLELAMPGQDAEFSFDIYYDGITREQWQRLLWTVTLGQNEEGADRCHKLGHGKPLGLGSVKLVVKECVERSFGENGYQLLQMPLEMTEPTGSANILNAVKKVLDLEQPLTGDNSGYQIDYPDIFGEGGHIIASAEKQKNNKAARHQWYSQNKDPRSKIQTLPDIMASSQLLQAYEYTGGERQQGRNSAYHLKKDSKRDLLRERFIQQR